MTTITLNNENKTEVTFEYDNGLPYKKSITPEYEYGNWSKNNEIVLIKIKLTEYEVSLFKDKNNFNLLSIHGQKDKIWFDLDDVYLILESNKYLHNKIQNKKFMLVFLENNIAISSLGYSK